MPTNISIQLPESSDMNFITHPMHNIEISPQQGIRKYRYKGMPRYEFYQALVQEKRSLFLNATVGKRKKWLDYLSALGQLKRLKQHN